MTGNGTYDCPYTINTVSDFCLFEEYVNTGHDLSGKWIEQTDNLDFGGTTVSPVGEYGSLCSFAGIYNGNGYCISNAIITSETTYTALFGQLAGKVINLEMCDVTITGDNCASIAATAANAEAAVVNCYSSASIHGSTSAGGIVNTFSGEVYNCWFDGELTGVISGELYATSCRIHSNNIVLDGDITNYSSDSIIVSGSHDSITHTLNETLFNSLQALGLETSIGCKWNVESKPYYLSTKRMLYLGLKKTIVLTLIILLSLLLFSLFAPEKSGRYANIEILRLLFALEVLIVHATQNGTNLRMSGYLGVEFFLIITGYNFAQYSQKRRADSFRIALKQNKTYIIKTLKKIYPQYLLATLIGFILLLCNVTSVKDKLEYSLALVGDLTLFQSLGISSLSVTGIVWYLGALLLALGVIGPIMFRFYDSYTYYFSLPIGVFLLGTVNAYGGHEMGTIAVLRIGTFYYGGCLLAIGMLSLGIFIYGLCEKLKEVEPTRRLRLVFTLLEIVVWVCVFLYVNNPSQQYDDVATLLIALGIFMTCSRFSYLENVFPSNVFGCLGTLSVIIFLNHVIWALHLEEFLTWFDYRIDRSLKVLAVLALTMLVGTIQYAVIQVVIRRKN